MLKFFGMQKAELVEGAHQKWKWLSMRLMALATTIIAVWGALSVADQREILELAPWVQPVLSISAVVSAIGAMRGRVLKQEGLE